MENLGNLNVFGTAEDNVLEQMFETLQVEGSVGALMADNHLGYRMPIGGVVAYPEHISPSGVGFDIGCGNTAVKTNLSYKDIKKGIPEIMHMIASVVNFGVGSKGSGGDVIEFFDWTNPIAKKYKNLAESQLGSVGGGNHYVDLLIDQEETVWIANHFGSRGLGHSIAKDTLAILGIKDTVMGEPALIKEGTTLFDDYYGAMTIAATYASCGRRIVIEQVLKILLANDVRWVTNHHNFARKESHFGYNYWVMRKGATPLNEGAFSFVGGTMADNSYILSGTDSDLLAKAMYSSPHGAGRMMSRTQAKKTFTKLEMDKKLQDKGVYVLGGDLDESPMAYKNIESVLDEHKDTFNVYYTLRPVGVIMAGRGVFDPYKD